MVTVMFKPFGPVKSVRYRFSLSTYQEHNVENWIFKKVGKSVSSRFQYSLEVHPGEECFFHGIM